MRTLTRGSSSTSPSPSPRSAGTPITALPDEEVLRLFPEPTTRLATEDVYKGLSFPERKERPYVLINMVSSLDGKAAAGGKASHIGSRTDRTLMRNLRAHADAVMTGAGTIRAEKLTLSVPENLARSRASRGLRPQPLAVVVTASGDVPLQANLLGSSPENLLVLTSAEIPKEHLATLSSQASTEVVAPAKDASGLDLTRSLGILKERYAVDLLLVEGGPVLNHRLVSTGLADELFLTLAPKLIGGKKPDTLTILEGESFPTPKVPDPALISLHLHNNELFLRYTLKP